MFIQFEWTVTRWRAMFAGKILSITTPRVENRADCVTPSDPFG